MIIPDVNLLLYASIQSYPQHTTARAWWSATLAKGVEVGLVEAVIFGFLRVATNPRVFDPPMSVDAATRLIEAWIAYPQVNVLTPGPRHLEIAFALLRALGSGGRMTTDVQIAAHAIETQAELHSNDTDFARFAGLRWVNPLEPRDVARR